MTNSEDILTKYEKGTYEGEYPTISPEDWSFLKENYPKDEVKEVLAKLFMKWPIPYADITEEDAYNAYMKLKGVRWNDIIREGDWFPRKAAESKYKYEYKGKKLYFSRTNVGNDASNFFQQVNRFSVDGAVSPGPERTWINLKFMTSLMGAAYSLKLEKIGKIELRTMIGLRKYICSQFKPSIAKAFYEMNQSKNVLDFSMGWGDRLAGAYAAESVEHYVGIDPRKENHPLYEKQRSFYKKHTSFFETPTKSDFYCSPAEDFSFKQFHDYFDMVFTSPPYFSVERYSHDDTQSWVRYKNIDSWNTDFLHKTLYNIIPTVKQGGIIAINIADVYTNSDWSTNRKWLEICNPMNDFLTENGMKYAGCLGMEMSRRPNNGGAGTAKTDDYTDETLQLTEDTKDKVFCEPIWIFEKK